MKKLILAVCSILFCIHTLHAQYWNITGNSATGSNFIGTTNAIPLNFRTNNAQRMTIDEKGYVGIGTTSPMSPLHINANVSGPWTYTWNEVRMTNQYCTNGFAFVQYFKEMRFVQQEEGSLKFEVPRGVLLMSPDGNVGIGNTSPKQKLHITNGNILISRGTTGAPGSTNGAILFAGTINNNINYANWAIEYVNSNDEGYGLNFAKPWNNSVSGFNYGLFLHDNGNVGIATKDPQYKLAVNGTIGAKEVIVTLAGWPDYVFAENYEPMSLPEIERYVQEHKHLPEVPSAAEVEENGVQLGEMNAILLKKIEELTLYTIDLQKQIEELKKGKE